jgi:hypothetical protein
METTRTTTKIKDGKLEWKKKEEEKKKKKTRKKKKINVMEFYYF